MANKKLVICCDGTWQHASNKFPTNVALTASGVSVKSGDGSPQLLHYDEGIGCARGVWPALTRKLGGAFGSGIEDNIRNVYRFICTNYDSGDDIYLFGFSRGAFAARSICGLINRVGVLRRDEIFLEEELLKDYKEKQNDLNWLTRFRETRTVPNSISAIAYLGVWDTVSALGLPDILPLASKMNRAFTFHEVGLVNSVRAARHAVAFDETRNMFPVSLWTKEELDRANSSSGQKQTAFRQEWFAGDHGNVGGGEFKKGLSSIALMWVLDGAIDAGLKFRQEFLADVQGQMERNSEVFAEFAPRKELLNGLPYSLGGFSRRRRIEDVKEELHITLMQRLRHEPGSSI